MGKSKFFFAAACAVFLSACEEDSLERIGYFKDDLNNRVFLFSSPNETDNETLQNSLNRLSHTDGQMTIAFVADQPSEALNDVVTSATDFMSANAAILDSGLGFRWWYRRNPNGEETFVDCLEQPGNTICL